MKPEKATTSDGTDFSSTEKISLNLKIYKITKTLADKFTPEELSEDEADDDQSGQETDPEKSSESQSEEKIAGKKIKKITGKKSAAKDEPDLPKRTKKGASESDSKGAKTLKNLEGKKVEILKYKKGKFNPFVTVREIHHQFEDTSEVARLDQSINNNTKELLRAAIIGSVKLYNEVVYSKKKIFSNDPDWGFEIEDLSLSPLKISMLKSDTKMIEAILKSREPGAKDNIKLNFAPRP